jgi:hypothetical protein
MLSSVPAVCGLARAAPLRRQRGWRGRLLCGVSGDGRGGSSAASAGMAGAAPLRRQRRWRGRLLCGDERRRRGLDRDFAAAVRREERRQCIGDLAVAHEGGCAMGNITRSAWGWDALRVIDLLV